MIKRTKIIGLRTKIESKNQKLRKYQSKEIKIKAKKWMVQILSERTDDLEERTFLFAKRVREFIKKLPRSIANHQDGIQLIKASGSVGANYIEAKEGASDKDYFYRIKVCKKEIRESTFWLKLLDT
jgi:four helix bundle protein